jgi:H+/gluconate symporter-like permease
MGVTGAATSIANYVADKFGEKRAITAVVVATALLTYGGVSLFVVVFAMYPIGATLFRRANVPKRLLPGAIALGAFTFTMTALPGSPQYLNTMPTVYFGTDIYAGPVLGIIAASIMFFG